MAGFIKCKELVRDTGKNVVFRCRVVNWTILETDKYESVVIPQPCAECPAMRANATSIEVHGCFVKVGSDFDPHQAENLVPGIV
jgi:hypothetical protein